MEKKLLVNGGYPLHTIEEVEDIYKLYISSPNDRKMIMDAYSFARGKHEGQMRKSGEPYYHHLVEVAYILATLQAGPVTIAAGLLHDVVEDTDVTIDDIEKMFGPEVARLVDSLTKIQRLKLSKITSEEFEAEDHRKILIGMAKDIRVIIIKLADRLHNLRTLASLSPERQIALSKETMEVFVPIAHRLGIESIKSEMADICLSYMEPERYKTVVSLLSKKAKSMQKNLEGFQKKIADLLFEKGIPFEISSRVKSINSIYNKMFIRGHLFEEIYDIMALRIITESEIQCYEILGLIHQIYKPVPGRFKDYIAMPKPNMYQSLHTTVLSGDGNMYEIQIRTKGMDEIAESGVAAHWAYKEGTGYNSKKEQEEIENKLHWFRDFVSLSKNNDDEKASEYVSNLTQDIFEANVYVFTPNGKVIELTNGSTPVDFAYRIHTKVGDTTIGALVNGVLVPLNTVLKTGDLVEIRTSKNAEPNEGWLDFVKTSNARSQIKKFLAKKNESLLREEKINKGKASCIEAFKDKDVEEEEMMKYLSDPKTLNYFGFENVDELFIGVSNRMPVTSTIVDFLHLKKKLKFGSRGKIKNDSDVSPVYCNGADRIAISLANCCTPIPGDEIVGYITRGSGITVHRKDCPNIKRETERLIDVFWRDNLDPASTYPVDIIIEANDRNNLLVDIVNTFSNLKVPISNIHGTVVKGGLIANFSITIYVNNLKRLSDIFNVLYNVKGVYDVHRVTH